MTREDLIKAADALPRSMPEAAGEYKRHSPVMVMEINQIMSKRGDLLTLIGPGNQAMMEDNHRNHALFMASLLLDFYPDVLVDTVLWVFRAYRAHGFSLTYWPAQLDTWIAVLKKHLSTPSYDVIAPIYEFMIIHQPAFAGLSDATFNPAYGQ